MRIYIVLFLFQLLVVNESVAQELRQDFVLQWQAPYRVEVNEEQADEALFFQGAVFNDSLSQVPFFIFQNQQELPFFRKDYSITSQEFIPVSPPEQRILEATGFKPQQVELHSGSEYIRKQHHSFVGLYPFRYNAVTQQYEKLVSFSLESQNVYEPSLSYEQQQEYAGNSVLAQGTWYKVCLDQTGIYRLDFEDLEALGMNMGGLQKAGIRLFGNGAPMLPEDNAAFRDDDLKENAIFISGGNSGTFARNDYLLFYGKGPDQWSYDATQGYFNHQVHHYSHENCYYISADQGPGKRISSRPGTQSQQTHTVSSFQDYAFHEKDSENLLTSGRIWYGEVFDATLTRSFNFPFENIDPSGPARVKTYFAARSGSPSSFTVKAGNEQSTTSVFQINPAAYEGYIARYAIDSLEFTPAQGNNLKVDVTYNRSSSGAKGWLNYIAVNVTRHLRFSGSQMAFRNTRVIGPGNVAQYVLGNAPGGINIWDVTDRFNIRQQQTTTSSGNLMFRLEADSLRELVAFDGSSFLSPRLQGKIPNQNLHAMQAHDLIIVSPEEFLPQAQRLASFREEHDGLSVAIVTPQQIYNEYSSGAVDISAIRNFMKMLYDRGQAPGDLPRYLLLFGNGTVDNKDLLGFGGNLIPTYQTLQSLTPSGGFEHGRSVEGSHMTDDYFGLLDDTEGKDARGIVDIGIGRLPVRTLEEATTMVDKIMRYDQRVPGMEPGASNLQFVGSTSNHDDWRNMVVLIADDEDHNIHLNHTESLAEDMTQRNGVYNLDKIYLDAYNQVTAAGGSRYPEVNKAINDRVNKGALLINYIGHGGTKGLAHERILTFDDIETWKNYYNMPVFMTATCEFSSFDQPDPGELSAGVRITLKSDGGAVALYTTTRLAWSSSNLTLNTNFMQNAFSRNEQGDFPRLGDLIRVAKEKSSSGGTLNWRLRNFVLLGDPSMQMAYPEYQVVTESISDTIMAFQQVTVSGYVADGSGNKVSGYQGVLFPTIFDKNNLIRTQGHDPSSYQAEFATRNSLLYKGKASVMDGEFSFSFVVPKDIAYNYGDGKISYYLDNGAVDGHGYFDGFKIGGTLQDYTPDDSGPQVQLFMNDTTFLAGGITSENPVLLALINDHSGINITGRIGHDIVAFLDGDLSSPYVLNQYFQADQDAYQSGKVIFPFFNLEDGPHTLSLRVWDIHNNPTLETLDFIVQSSAQLALKDLMNYPNPFSSHTRFVFSHNQSSQPMEVQIDIFDMNGRLLQSLHSQMQSAGYQSPPVSWDGRDHAGKPLGNGIYIYRLTLNAPSGEVLQQTRKLVILR